MSAGAEKVKFYGCSNYPACKFVSWDKPLEKRCPKCGYFLVESTFRGLAGVRCGNKECGYQETGEKGG